MKIENVNIVLPEKVVFGTVSFQGEKIESVEIISDENKECTQYVMAAGIDPHVHLRDPGFTQKETVETGTKSALHGGITTVFDMPNTAPATISQNAFDMKVEHFKENSECNWKLFLGVTEKNLEFLETIESPYLAGFKIYLGSSTGDLLLEKDSAIRNAFEIAAERDLVVSLHCESEKLLQEGRKNFTGDLKDPASHSEMRSEMAAYESVKHSIQLARETGARINVCHVSTSIEMDLIVAAKKEGLKVTCEMAPHHLFLDTESYKKFGTRVQMNPPLRSPETRKKLWSFIKNGDVDMIATDHAPHTLEEKDQEFGKAPSGIPGLESSFPLMLSKYESKELTLSEITCLMSKHAADIFELNTGKIAEGKDADLILLDFSEDWKVENGKMQTKNNWSAFDGLVVPGKLKKIWMKGKECYCN